MADTEAPVAAGWDGRSRGGRFGTAAVAWFIRLGGRDVCYLLLTVPALWFWLTDGPARRAITSYWIRLRGLPPWRARLYALLHFWHFARGLADRMIATVQPQALHFDQLGIEGMLHAMEHPQGCILLSAHIGSFELAARWLANGHGRALQVCMLDAEDPRVREQLRRTLGSRPYGVIELRDPASAALAITAALRRGETCCLLGDRTAGSTDGTRPVRFLNGTIRLPIGPFIAAAVTGALVVPTFCVRRGWRTWRCAADPAWVIDLGPRQGREERLQAVLDRWAERLEFEVRQHPWAWNNYFDPWLTRG
jgi:predicted LPLAT superfamily acyltransferase